jgi:hypothetical protein
VREYEQDRPADISEVLSPPADPATPASALMVKLVGKQSQNQAFVTMKTNDFVSDHRLVFSIAPLCPVP